jgi:hypothetical protein
LLPKNIWFPPRDSVLAEAPSGGRVAVDWFGADMIGKNRRPGFEVPEEEADPDQRKTAPEQALTPVHARRPGACLSKARRSGGCRNLGASSHGAIGALLHGLCNIVPSRRSPTPLPPAATLWQEQERTRLQPRTRGSP